jgi:hypothetical protein
MYRAHLRTVSVDVYCFDWELLKLTFETGRLLTDGSLRDIATYGLDETLREYRSRAIEAPSSSLLPRVRCGRRVRTSTGDQGA